LLRSGVGHVGWMWWWCGWYGWLWWWLDAFVVVGCGCRGWMRRRWLDVAVDRRRGSLFG
jgi:hypothetical protein